MDAKLSARRALPPFDVCLQDLRVYMVCVCECKHRTPQKIIHSTVMDKNVHRSSEELFIYSALRVLFQGA